MRNFRRFSYKDTNLKVAGDHFDVVTSEVIAQRKQLEKYIRRHPAFQSALEPVLLQSDAPEVARRMALASEKTGLGPMAAVAGTLAQLGAEKALEMGTSEVIVENGGDMYIACGSVLTIGIHTGDEKFGDALAFELPASRVAICSSSSRMGHSLSFGNCALATAVSADAAMADAAATLLGNLITSPDTLPDAVERVGTIEGIDGVMAIIDGQIGLYGNLPKIVKNQDPDTAHKITRDRLSE